MSFILHSPHNHNADILNNSVKLGINIYDEFNNIYSFNKSLTHHSNKIYFLASNLVNIILIHIVKSCEYYPYTYSQIIYRWERLTRTVTP